MIRQIVPPLIKQIIQNHYIRFRYNVKLCKGSHVHNTEFEKDCLVGEKSKIFSSKIGRSSYVGRSCIIRYANIGRFCALGDEVTICIGNHPAEKIVSIHPCFYSLEGHSTLSYVKKQLFEEHTFVDNKKKYVACLGNDVWIGNRVSILDGVTIGDGAIIGTNAVVTKDVEPFSIVGGIPAKHIKYRFSKNQRDFLLQFKWWNKQPDWFIRNACYYSDIDEFIKTFLKDKSEVS